MVFLAAALRGALAGVVFFAVAAAFLAGALATLTGADFFTAGAATFLVGAFFALRGEVLAGTDSGAGLRARRTRAIARSSPEIACIMMCEGMS
ncbi:hypothetical protein BKG61_17670 [Mycobacterium syngnathidarum]|uniref:Uncharacterized protein n=1 Tax=Mycobacterium syngnathidarum TaxID=1908205 RepID=A0A1S1K1W5_9MYCO|nr:hypothetical protein BKG61_17670 [Mycobacterium syngnathidarum]